MIELVRFVKAEDMRNQQRLFRENWAEEEINQVLTTLEVGSGSTKVK